MGHPWGNAVDSDTDVALSSNRHGIEVGGTWNVWSAGVRVGVTRERRAIPHERGTREGWGRARGARGPERLRRSCGEVCRGRGPATVTLVVGAGVATPRSITSAITLVPAVRTAAAPPTHFLFPCLKHGAVSVMCGKLGIEK